MENSRNPEMTENTTLCAKSKCAPSEESKKISIIAYITWIGFAIAFVKGDLKDDYFRFHINQALLLNLVGMAGFFLPLVGLILSMVILVFWIIALCGALKGEMRKVPLIGGIELLN